MAKASAKFFFILILACWTLCIFSILIYEIREHWLGLLGTLERTADIAFEKDLTMRRWNADHGGVYVPVTDKTRPNPYLAAVPDRDATTRAGKKLTLINPAYMIRQLYELETGADSMIGHITSLKPLRPENRPDAWETAALQTFEQGRDRFSSIDRLNNKSYFRFMRPLTTEKACLKCHAKQGYREGDIRGGISISILFDPFLAENRKNNFRDIMGYGLIWVLGCGLLFFGKISHDRKSRSLVESEEKYFKAFHRAPLLIAISSIDSGAYLEVNDAFLRTSGFARADVIGKTSLELGWILPADRQRLINELNTKGCVENLELDLVCKSGVVVSCLYFGELLTINGEQRLLSIAQDITLRKQAEKALQASEKKYRSIILNSPDLTMIQDMNGQVLYISPQAEKVTGHPPAIFLGQGFLEFIHPVDREKAREAMANMLSGGELVDFEYRFSGRDGSQHWLSHTAKPITHDGKIYSIQSSVRNITERKKIEQELLHTREINENLLKAANVIIVGSDAQGRITLFNETAEKLTGYTAAELAGRNLFEVLMPEFKFPAALAELRTMDKQGMPRTFEKPILTKSGEVRFISWQNNVVSHDGEMIGSLSFGLDISEQKSLQAQFIHAQKMESVGTLAGGVAHDFNNILTVISGNVTMMKMDLQPNHDLHPYLQQIEEASSKAASLTQSLLAFSRKQVISPKPSDINTEVRNIRKMLMRLIGEDIDLEVTLSPQPLTVMIDTSQMDQVFINLIVNARDAMPEGGTIRITTRSVQVNLEAARMNDIAPGYYAEISIADTGCGMDKATADRIFEPFFTTKEQGKGTGLGLAMVYGAIRQQQGAILVQSDMNVGSTFTIYLPLIEAAETATSRTMPLAFPRGTGTILLAEDETAVRTITVKILQSQGYTVLTAVDGEDAVHLFREHADTIDLVILDVVMPTMNGKQAYDQIKLIRPEAKIIFATGYTDDILTIKGIHDEKLVVMQKPISPLELLQTIEEQFHP